jgi:hypothetical protein
VGGGGGWGGGGGGGGGGGVGGRGGGGWQGPDGRAGGDQGGPPGRPANRWGPGLFGRHCSIQRWTPNAPNLSSTRGSISILAPISSPAPVPPQAMTSTSPNGNGTRPVPAARPGQMPTALELIRRAEAGAPAPRVEQQLKPCIKSRKLAEDINNPVERMP